MKKFYVKINNMYLDYLSVSSNDLENEFVELIKFSTQASFCNYKVDDGSQDNISELLNRILGISLEAIYFEEVKQ